MNSQFKYVVLEGIEHKNRFYSMNHENPEKLANGEVAYRVLGYANTDEDARAIIGEEYQKNAVWGYVNRLCNALYKGEVDEL